MKAFQRRYHRPGTPPGSYDVEHLRRVEAPQITVTDYSPVTEETRTFEAPKFPEPQEKRAIRWISITGRPSVEVLDWVRKDHGVDPLALEDVVNVGQRPKFNEYDNGLFITLVIPEVSPRERGQLSLFVAGNLLISFIDTDESLFQPIRDRLKGPTSIIRQKDVYYLLYAILDLVIDLYFPVLDTYATRLVELEEEMLNDPSQEELAETHDVRHQLLIHRRNAWATREVINSLSHHMDGGSSAQRYIKPYLQDCHDHVLGVIDLIENYREIAANLVEIYLSAVSNRMNDIMKVLTIIATIFIPPTFIVGVYGMNFDRQAGPLSMPELGSPYGYVGVLGFIVLMSIGLIAYFKHKGWI